MSCDAMTQNSRFSVEIANGKFLRSRKVLSSPPPTLFLFFQFFHLPPSQNILDNSSKFTQILFIIIVVAATEVKFEIWKKCFSHRNCSVVTTTSSNSNSTQEKCGNSRQGFLSRFHEKLCSRVLCVLPSLAGKRDSIGWNFIKFHKGSHFNSASSVFAIFLKISKLQKISSASCRPLQPSFFAERMLFFLVNGKLIDGGDE